MAARATPHVVVLGGPNGAGKSTVAPRLLRDALRVTTLLTGERATFAFESTLAGLGARDVLARCRDAGYAVHLAYLWLPSPEFALTRVRRRVEEGGHDVPERDVRRRWGRSLVNFFDHYAPLADTWRVYDGSAEHWSSAVARGGIGRAAAVRNAAVWATITQQADAIRRGEPLP